MVPADRIWVMGDHRSQSGDSLEHWTTTGEIEKSTISEDAVVGRAFVLFWPFGRADWLSAPDTFESVPSGSGG